MIDFVACKLGKMFCHGGVARCLCFLGHVLIHLCTFNKFCGHGVHEVLMVALHETVELGVFLEVLLVLISGGMLQDVFRRGIKTPLAG